METCLEVLFTPAEFALLPKRDLTATVCVVFDVLRATSSMVTALANGATSLLPVSEIEDAIALRKKDEGILLAGERHGLRIDATLTGGIEFDFGNSPREFTREKVSGKRIVMTTTNGTRALKACASARAVWISSFLNLAATADSLRKSPPDKLLVVCSGTFEEAALEDVLAAGALCESLAELFPGRAVADSAVIARKLFAQARNNLLEGLSGSRNARRLLERPELREDVAFCARQDQFDLTARMGRDGWVVKAS